MPPCHFLANLQLISVSVPTRLIWFYLPYLYSSILRENTPFAPEPIRGLFLGHVLFRKMKILHIEANRDWVKRTMCRSNHWDNFRFPAGVSNRVGQDDLINPFEYRMFMWLRSYLDPRLRDESMERIVWFLTLGPSALLAPPLVWATLGGLKNYVSPSMDRRSTL